MKRRAVDLSLKELATMGANAALRAAHEAKDAGWVVTGTVDFSEEDQSASVLAECHPSGAVTLLHTPAGNRVTEASDIAETKRRLGAAD